MSDQRKAASLIEVCMNVGLGLVVSMLYWPFVGERYDIDYTVARHVGITLEFTALSVARGYVVRRFWANSMHETAARVARRWFHAGR